MAFMVFGYFTTYLNTVVDQLHHLIALAMASFSRKIPPAIESKLWGSDLRNMIGVGGVDLAFKSIRSQFNAGSMRCAEQTNPMHGGSTLPLRGLGPGFQRSPLEA